MSTTHGRQLSFETRPHPQAVRDDDDQGYLSASLKISGDLWLDHNLYDGDELTVTVASADGEVIAQAVAEVGPIAFQPIKEKRVRIGTNRAHTAKVTEGD
jgi:hypothetical protein